MTCAASGVCHETQKEEQTNKAEKLLGFFTSIIYGCTRYNLVWLTDPERGQVAQTLAGPWASESP